MSLQKQLPETKQTQKNTGESPSPECILSASVLQALYVILSHTAPHSAWMLLTQHTEHSQPQSQSSAGARQRQGRF